MNATVPRVGTAVEVADDHEREHVERAHQDEEAQRVEDRREHHREEEEVGDRAGGSAVCRDRDRDQGDHAHAPRDEEASP